MDARGTGTTGVSEAPDYVIGPVGERLTLKALPCPSPSVRWTIFRKAEIVAAVRGGLLTFDEACTRYGLAHEELLRWQRAIQRSGVLGLRVTRPHEYRHADDRLDGY